MAVMIAVIMLGQPAVAHCVRFHIIILTKTLTEAILAGVMFTITKLFRNNLKAK
jgi:hypothetical protein